MISSCLVMDDLAYEVSRMNTLAGITMKFRVELEIVAAVMVFGSQLLAGAAHLKHAMRCQENTFLLGYSRGGIGPARKHHELLSPRLGGVQPCRAEG